MAQKVIDVVGTSKESFAKAAENAAAAPCCCELP
jgi:flavin-binding protein dodecin